MTDEHGVLITASVQTYGDTIHTFVERKDYKGVFMPGFRAHHLKDPVNSKFAIPQFECVDHVVGNQPDKEMVAAADWYEKMLDFHRFWSVDDSIMHTDYSSLRYPSCPI